MVDLITWAMKNKGSVFNFPWFSYDHSSPPVKLIIYWICCSIVSWFRLLQSLLYQRPLSDIQYSLWPVINLPYCVSFSSLTRKLTFHTLISMILQEH